MTPNLDQYIARINTFNRIFKMPLIDAKNLTAQNKADILHRVNNDLSPENLGCDGECSAKQIKQKRAFLAAVLKEMNTIK